ncbi:MAG: hypothetical protein KBT05_07395, partial [Bacteroidales bacterium]|nr:hypothetical protein [Candidatus Cryptobacteroides caccocaballi]
VIEAIQLEAFLDNFTHLKSIQSGKKCDLMLVSEDKVVFCDMTCSMSKYISPYKMKDGQLKIGKRNTVKQQVEKTRARDPLQRLHLTPRYENALTPLNETKLTPTEKTLQGIFL